MTTIKLPSVSKQEFLDAIRNGVADAVWQMITNATAAPCADFYDFVKDGVAEGIERLDLHDAIKDGIMERLKAEPFPAPPAMEVKS
jgi:hypothetical protein